MAAAFRSGGQGFSQAAQYAAIVWFSGPRTACPQGTQLLLQTSQFPDALLNVFQMCLNQCVYVAAVAAFAGQKQRSDLVDAHVQRATVANERQTLQRRLGVVAVVACAADGGREQTNALIVANGFDRTAGRTGEVTNFHRVIVSA